MKVAIFLAIFGVASAHLRKNPSYADEADDIKSMMEKVRQQTEGGDAKPASTTALTAHAQKLEAGEFFPGEHKLDNQLMAKAEEAKKAVAEMEKMEDPTKPKRKSLAKVATKTQESEATRAARFFATHGMKKIGHALGETLSADAEKKAVAEYKVAQSKIAEVVPVPAHQAAEAASSSADMDLEDPGDDDDQDESVKKQWAAVDALKARAPH
eukprot:gnl/MRDRNA2_/MRDRNA2_88420_c0_seq1.p1 gnl/MRDRNA2_/MRDRNA2_88420_c0~~gnl/MRDRNA2_/MRDRNA2_88420_c0_seq1.p1  ORF type:complete len:238 (-),score=87.42 gnl/MRDRNA2_/MRDRNA2_88420_c0_seq1:74-709(-)